MLDTSSAPNPLTPLSFLRLVLPELLCALLFLVIGASLGEVAPFNGAFFEQDPSLSKDYRASTVPTWLLGVLCAALPGAALAVLEPLSLHRSQRGGCRCPLFLCAGLALALTSTMLATNATKSFVGSKRPNFFAYCDYMGYAAAAGTRNASSAAWRAYAAATAPGAPGVLARCAAGERAVEDAQRSFPSGHSSLSFAGLGFLALALRHLAGLRPGDWLSPSAAACGAPLALATYVAATRVRDNYHREIDVAAGAAIGLALAHAAWGTLRARYGARLPPPLCGGRRGKGGEEGEGGEGPDEEAGP